MERALRLARPAATALLVAAALPALAYLPPANAILKRTAQRRDELKLTALEVRGTIVFAGAAAERLRAAAGIPGDRDLTVPAVLLMKAPSRCRLELALEGMPSAQRPALWIRGGRASGQRGLGDSPAARALVEGLCTLLAEKGAGSEPERGLAQRLTEHGVDLREVSLGRQQGRVSWIIGGRQQDSRPQAWVDKQTFQPVRLVAPLGGSTRDLRLLDSGGAGGERFPRVVEVWAGGQLEARFSTEAVTPNPRLPDSAFP